MPSGAPDGCSQIPGQTTITVQQSHLRTTRSGVTQPEVRSRFHAVSWPQQDILVFRSGKRRRRARLIGDWRSAPDPCRSHRQFLKHLWFKWHAACALQSVQRPELTGAGVSVSHAVPVPPGTTTPEPVNCIGTATGGRKLRSNPSCSDQSDGHAALNYLEAQATKIGKFSQQQRTDRQSNWLVDSTYQVDQLDMDERMDQISATNNTLSSA